MAKKKKEQFTVQLMKERNKIDKKHKSFAKQLQRKITKKKNFAFLLKKVQQRSIKNLKKYLMLVCSLATKTKRGKLIFYFTLLNLLLSISNIILSLPSLSIVSLILS